jgi:hypothetical protein
MDGRDGDGITVTSWSHEIARGRRRGGKRLWTVAVPVTKTGKEAPSSPEWVTPAASALGNDRRVVDGARGVTPQLVVGSSTVAGAHGGGGGSLERSQRCRAVDTALEALT